jgi:hypothetical protein
MNGNEKESKTILRKNILCGNRSTIEGEFSSF